MPRLSCLLLAFLLALPTVGVVAVERPAWSHPTDPCPPPPPRVFRLGGMTDEEIAAIRMVPGVESVELIGGRHRVTWQPFNHESWPSHRKWIAGAERLYDCLVIKKPLGRTRWTHGGRTAPPPGIVPFTVSSEAWLVSFEDQATRRKSTMTMVGHAVPQPGQLVHEMVRNLIGEKHEIVPCGAGHVIVSRNQHGITTSWQIDDHWYACIEDSFDAEMVAAYIARFGCVTPADFTVDMDAWIEQEIRWRFEIIDRGLRNVEMLDRDPELAYLQTHARMLYLFTRLPQRFGMMDRDMPLADKWMWFHHARRFVWANRGNFRLDQDECHLCLVGPDRYDPEHPPELPPELSDPPLPVPRPSPSTAP